MLNDIQKHILEIVSGMAADAQGAVNIRANGKRAYHSNCEGVRIESKTDKEGIDIIIGPGVKADHVYIPVVVTEEGFHDVVYNDFFIGRAPSSPSTQAAASTTAVPATLSMMASTPSMWARTPSSPTPMSTMARVRARASAS